MYVKAILYVVFVLLAIWALDSVKIDNIFKQKKYYASRVLYLMISMALSYLVVNFLYDFFLYSKII